MTKKPERSELEFLRAENRRLKSENRHLKKQVGRTNKRVKHFENVVAEHEEPEMVAPVVEEAPRCPECGSEVKVVDIGVRTLINCDDCGHRKAVKRKK